MLERDDRLAELFLKYSQGTPHFGGPLSKFVHDHSDDWYFFDSIKLNRCRAGKVEPKKLRTIYSDIFTYPIDKGAIEALIPGSIAYSRLHQTNVKSYAIAGTYEMLQRATVLKNHIIKLS
jgi:hypothetical protein